MIPPVQVSPLIKFTRYSALLVGMILLGIQFTLRQLLTKARGPGPLLPSTAHLAVPSLALL